MEKRCVQLGRRISSYLPGYLRLQLDHIPTTELLPTVREWIEDCTEIIAKDKTFCAYLNDGLILCRLIQVIQPGLIKRTNKVKNPFAYRENILFFLEACHKLGLRDSQLFTPEDLHSIASNQSKSRSQESKLRKYNGLRVSIVNCDEQVCESLYCLGIKAKELPSYIGPDIFLFPDKAVDRRVGKGFSSTQNISSAVSHSYHTNIGSKGPVRKVQSVVSLIPTTSNTSRESFPAVISFLNDSKQVPSDTSVGSQQSLSCLNETDQFRSPDTSSHLLNKATSLQHLNTRAFTSGGNLSQSDYQVFDFPSSPSEASTVVQGILELSQSSDGKISSHSIHGHRFDSVSTTAHSQPHATEDDVFLNNPFSPVHLGNAPARTHIDRTGIIHDSTSSQDNFAAFYGSPERDITYQYSLTQKSEDSYPSYSLDRRKYSQRLKTVESEEHFCPSDQESTKDSTEASSMCDTVASNMAVEKDVKTEPVDILVTSSSVPHHSILIGGPESPSSFQEDISKENGVQEVEVHLLPGEERLGLNLVEEADGSLTIKAIGPDTAASHVDLQCYDKLLSVNNTLLTNTPLNEALVILQEAMATGRLFLSIHRPDYKKPLGKNQYKSIRPPDLLDISRVTSDALPHSLNATTVHLDREETPDFKNSSIVEVLSSPEEPMENEKKGTSVSVVPTDTQPSQTSTVRNAKSARPLSAPTKTAASVASVPAHKSHTLPTKRNILLKQTKDRQTAEREKRSASIHSNAQILFKYAQNRQSSHSSSSLQADNQSPSRVNKLYESSTIDQQKSVTDGDSPSLSCSHQSSSSITMDEHSSASTPLNLRHISMDETRLVSVMQMDSIWKQVESGDDSPSLTARHSSSLLFEDEVVDINEPIVPLKTSDNHILESGSIFTLQPPSVPTDKSATTHTTSATPSLKTPTPVSTSASIPISTPTPPSTYPAPIAASTPVTQSELLLNTDTSVSAPEKDAETSQRIASFDSKDIDSLLLTLKSLPLPNEGADDLKALEDVLKSNNFKKAKKVHDQMHQLLSDTGSKSIVRRIVPTSQLLRQSLHDSEHCKEVEELSALLNNAHVQALLFCHDKVSTHDLYVPETTFHRAAQDPVDIILSASVYNFNTALHPSSSQAMFLSRDVPSGRKEGAVIVFVERTNKPLGVTIYKQENSAFIGKLMKGCDAETSGVLREGDELLEVNGMPIWDKTTDHIVTLMSPGRTEEGDILVLTIIPLHDDNVDLEYEIKYMRAHFNYNGQLDEEIPCKAVGLAFQKGDILEISNQDDPNWWQARKVFDDGAESLPGLIPSRHLQQQREAMVQSYPLNHSSGNKTKRSKGIGSIFKKKKKKVFYHHSSASNSIGVGDEVPTYEEVMRLEPDQNRYRPIVLVGTPGVGKKALIRELISSNPSYFSTVVPHTSRNPRHNEMEGKDFYFVTKEEFESDLNRDRFLEHKEIKGIYYGSSFVTIKKIIESSRVPVIDVNPQALTKLRYSGLQPYVVFIAASRLEKKSIHGSSGRLTDEDLIYTEHDLKQMGEESFLIENQYGHYFDWVIVNDDFQVAKDMLKEVVRRVEEEPQWIPSLWKNERYL